MADEGVTGIAPGAPDLPIRGGAFVAVVGPSGAGKDTLIAYARRRLAGEEAAIFVRRVVTRPSDAAFEDHDTLTGPAFDEALAAGGFAVTWQAHGLKYGLPAGIDRMLGENRVAIANISRGAVPAVRQRYARVTVVEITAAPAVLATRLSERGRETGDALRSRLVRTVAPDACGIDFRRLDNSGPVPIAGEALAVIIGEAIRNCRAG